MERYGLGSMAEESRSDPAAEWASPGPDTGLEDSIWQLGLRGDGGGNSYPEREGRADCAFYLRTGSCGFGLQCRFNHPRDRNLAFWGGTPGVLLPEREGQPVCKFYMRTGRCNFGTTCKYHHPRDGGAPVNPVPLNYLGYPLRPGERECSYYVRTGECKFGISCKFHHPQPVEMQAPPLPAPPFSPFPAPLPPTALYQPVQSPTGPSTQQYGILGSSWQVARPSGVSGPYFQGPYGPVLLSPGIGWSPYPAPLSPVASSSSHPTAGAAPIYGMTQLSPPAPALSGPYGLLSSSFDPSMSAHSRHMFPERPGKRECQYYMKTGDCKFGSSCRYHHPPEWRATKADCAFSPEGLPLRPGERICAFYSQHGTCKFGQTCKFDHPMRSLSYTSSVSSLSDMTVAPYPVGSSFGTVALPSSSSDSRSELVSGSSRESFPVRIYSSTSGMVGSVFSRLTQDPVPSAHGGETQASS